MLPVENGSEPVNPIYRDNGVYLIIGGAGGLGQAWTESLCNGTIAKSFGQVEKPLMMKSVIHCVPWRDSVMLPCTYRLMPPSHTKWSNYDTPSSVNMAG